MKKKIEASKSHAYKSESGEKGHMIFVKSKRPEGGLTLKKVPKHKPKSMKHSKEDLKMAHKHMHEHMR